MAFLPMALTTAPYASLQVVIALGLVKSLSLRRLFLLSALLLLVGDLLPFLTMHVVPESIRWVNGWLYRTASSPFALLIPVLILALGGRRRTASTCAPSPVGEAANTSDTTGAQERPVVCGEKILWRWYYWDISLAVLPLWFGIILDPFGILSYLGGLINVPIALEAGMMSIMLVPAVPLCLVVLLTRMLVTWPRHIHGWRRLLLAWGTPLAVFAIVFVLPFIAHTINPMGAFMSGFTKHVQRRADIPAVQAWLDTLDRKSLADPKQQSRITTDESNLPASVRRLRAWHTSVSLDDKGRPMIRLLWGSGVMGGWGLVVGHREMAVPPSDLSRYGEYREPVAPGAYIWHEIQ
ncbi:MAG: hypothetical protein NTZ17_02215 [Phycisphaerae bacterium]|nr:hypothetical protein [Phycisphaerae bacterium]